MHATLRGRTCLKLRLVMPKGRRGGSHEHRAGRFGAALPGPPAGGGQGLYDAMLTPLRGAGTTGNCVCAPGEQAVFRAYSALRDDHPGCSGSAGGARSPQTGDMRCAVLYTPDQIGRIRYQLRRCLFPARARDGGAAAGRREILVYERIAGRLTYINNGDVRDHNIVGPVLLSAGVCEGYNALLMLAPAPRRPPVHQGLRRG